MTKADKIRATAKKHPSWSTARIGEACDCSPEYVRVALRQRVNGQPSRADLNLAARLLAEYGVSTHTHLRYRIDPEFRKAYIAANARRQKARIQADPAYREQRNAYWKAYRAKKREAACPPG
jgi:Zn-dependent peptidase ImmA (M78 family)